MNVERLTQLRTGTILIQTEKSFEFFICAL